MNTEKKKVICIIPARGKSKGLPQKNLVPLCGKPLIDYIINSAKKSHYIDEIYVSTENGEIKKHVLSLGIKVVDRPPELAGDDVMSEDVLLHAITKILKPEDYNKTICLFAQATSPLTLPSDLDKLVECIIKHNKDSAAFFVKDFAHFFESDDVMRIRLPRQKLKPRKRETGNAWVFKVKLFLKYKRRLFGDYGMIEIKKPRNLEIDDYIDLKIIEGLLKNNLQGGKDETE